MKIISKLRVLTAVLFCTAVLATAVCAGPAVTVSSGDASAGESIELTVSLSDNPGVAFMLLTLDYDSDVFTLTGVTDGGLLGSSMHSPGYTADPYKLMWFNGTARENFKENGVIATLSFDVSADAESGEYSFSVSYDNQKSEIMDSDFKKVEFLCVDGSVNVAGKPKPVYEPEFDSESFTYDGKEKRITVSGLPEGAEVVYKNNTATDVGVYRATATVKIPGEDDRVLSAVLTVKPRTLTVEGLQAADKVYDGNAGCTLFGGRLAGAVSGDDVYARMPTVGRFADAAVGEGKRVTFDEIRLLGGDADNYILKQPTLRADITAAGQDSGSGESGATESSDDGSAEDTLPTAPGLGGAWTNPYIDVGINDWYYGAVKYVSENGIMNGVAGDMFAPDGEVTRAMFVTVLYRMEGSPDAGPCVFADVADGMWYTDAVCWASGEGIVNGVSEDMFAPDAVLTREQMAAVLYRYAGFRGFALETVYTPVFADGDYISPWALDAVRWCAAVKLLSGNGDGMILPSGAALRSQCAAVLERFAGIR